MSGCRQGCFVNAHGATATTRPVRLTATCRGIEMPAAGGVLAPVALRRRWAQAARGSRGGVGTYAQEFQRCVPLRVLVEQPAGARKGRSGGQQACIVRPPADAAIAPRATPGLAAVGLALADIGLAQLQAVLAEHLA